MVNRTIAAGIVLFNPENIKRLIQCIEKVNAQVEHIYLFDNSTRKIDLLLPDGVTYMTEKKNKGIAYALNRIMEQAEEDGYSWVLTMDQDSVLPDGMVEDFIKYTGTNENVGIICPQVIDKRRAYMQVDKSEEIKYLDMCITSASCTSISAWKVVGKFDEWLFIDLVDNEFCKRLIASGYKILQVNKWVLDQEFGKIIPKSKRKQRFWIEVSRIFHNENIAKLSYKKYVNPLRVYYTNRNIIYVNKKLRKYGMVAYENYNCKEYIGFWVCFNIPSILRAQSKIEVVKAIIRGVKDGTEVCVDEWVARKDKI